MYKSTENYFFFFAVKRIRGAYKVHAYTDHAMHEKVSEVQI